MRASNIYSFAISSIKLHDIIRCMHDILDLNTKLGLVADAESTFALDSVVELQHQENYVCLNREYEENELIPTYFTKQRSDRWHSDSNSAKVTGSTIFQALATMRHGIDNERNAVGTLVGRILPIFVQGFKFHEEEGYSRIPNENDPTFMVVSPDGSCREESNTQYAEEIKCPVPDKKYTTDDH